MGQPTAIKIFIDDLSLIFLAVALSSLFLRSGDWDFANCNACRENVHVNYAARNTQVAHDDAIEDDHPPEGVHIVEPDEFDNEFGDGQEFVNLLLPDDSAISACEKGLLQNFLKAEKALSHDTCPVCHEIDWDMKMKDGQCHRCRDDKKGIVKKFSSENNVNPSEVPLALRDLTDMEEMMISLNLPLMQVRYTKG
ncbi:hypothetical protein C8J56DRAFT_780947, partial [Mycena floridula]